MPVSSIVATLNPSNPWCRCYVGSGVGFCTTRMNCCNSILATLPQSSSDPLHWVQNAAARLITGTGTREHITPALRSLHWLPVKFRIRFKQCVLLHLVHIGHAPAYLSDIVTATADLPSRKRLRFSNTFRYELPILKRKFGERGSSYFYLFYFNRLLVKAYI